MALNRKAAEEFARYWAGRGDEKGETQQFWIDLLQNVLGNDDALRHLRFEARVDTEAGSSKGFADVTVMRADGRGALAMVEQKSANVDLDKPEQRQGRMVTPVQQCRAYAEALPFNEQPRWVLTCNFKAIRAYDRNMDPLCSKAPALELALSDLPRNLDALSFLTGGATRPRYSPTRCRCRPAHSWAGCMTCSPTPSPRSWTPTTRPSTTPSPSYARA